MEIPVSTTEDFPCCVRSSSFVHATANTPARLPGARFARFPGSVSLPRIDWQVGPCITLFEACSAFTHVAACTLAKSLYDPLHRRLQPLRYLHDCSDCYRLERKSPGGIRTHWKSAALARRTSNSGGQLARLDALLKAWADTSSMATAASGAFAGMNLTLSFAGVASGSRCWRETRLAAGRENFLAMCTGCLGVS